MLSVFAEDGGGKSSPKWSENKVECGIQSMFACRVLRVRTDQPDPVLGSPGTSFSSPST